VLLLITRTQNPSATPRYSGWREIIPSHRSRRNRTSTQRTPCRSSSAERSRCRYSSRRALAGPDGQQRARALSIIPALLLHRTTPPVDLESVRARTAAFLGSLFRFDFGKNTPGPRLSKIPARPRACGLILR
jgi:hypothetical protein